MTTIKFLLNGKTINGIMLGRYQCPHDEIHEFPKRFLWKRKTIYKKKTLHTPLYIIFIPWKHQEKEIVEIDEKYIIHPESLVLDESWIRVGKFISKSFGSYIYHEGMEVNDFIGYRFIYDKNDFIINLPLQETRDNLTLLYKNMPELLELDLGNPE